MKITIEHNDDEDELEARVQAVFNQVVGEHVQTTDDRTEDPPNANNHKKVPDDFKDANRDEYGREVTNESIVRNWKNFLYS